jgi:hypothetical protein
VPYSGNVRLVVPAILFLCLAGSAAPARQANQPQVQPQEDQYFSGVVTKIETGKITVTRTVLGKEDATKTFAVTAETRTEGKPKVRARVTVRFVTSEDGDRAVHIVVRK